MKLFLLRVLAALPLFFAVTSFASALDPREVVESLSDADLAQFLPLLKQNYIDPKKLADVEISRATVQGLMARLAPGAAILQVSEITAAEPRPFRSEVVEERVGYLRVGSLTMPNIAALDAALLTFGGKVSAIVLDLRATPAGSEFDQAAEVCQRFCQKGKVLFTLKRTNPNEERIVTSKSESQFRGLLAVLVDRETAGAAEVIAAVLRTQAKAMVIGQVTRGAAAEFADLPLPSGKLVLRVAVGEVALPENVSVFPGGVKPDLAVEVSPETTEAVLKAGLEKGVKDLVTETERPRMNEAALVSGNNPELEAYQANQRARTEKAKPPLRDVVLQRALDFVTTVSLYEKKAGGK